VTAVDKVIVTVFDNKRLRKEIMPLFCSKPVKKRQRFKKPSGFSASSKWDKIKQWNKSAFFQRNWD
jgi:hypothetical protein